MEKRAQNKKEVILLNYIISGQPRIPAYPESPSSLGLLGDINIGFTVARQA